MPYTRDVILAGSAFGLQQLTLEQARPAWSEPYRVDGARLLLPLEGALGCKVADRAWHCDASVALWLEPGQAYRLRQPARGQRSLLITLVDSESRSCRVPVPPATHWRLLRLRRTRAAADALAAEEDLAAIVSTLTPPGGARAIAYRAPVERALAFLSARFTQGDRLGEIARAVSCSPYHLARCFRRTTGLTLHEWRTRLRMAQALRCLAQGRASLAELALDLGYASHSHFGQAFRATFGIAPSQVRRILIAAG